MAIIPTRSITQNGRAISEAAGDMFKGIAAKAGKGLSEADKVVKSHNGFLGTAKHFYKEKPVTSLAVTGAAVASTAIVGANTMRAMAPSQHERGHHR